MLQHTQDPKSGKRIALLLYGIHYQRNHPHWMGWSTTIDFQKSLANYAKYIFAHFSSKNVSVDVFVSSYHSEKENAMLEAYKPKAYRLANLDPSKTHIRQKNERVKEVIDLALREGCSSAYESFVLTRFDLEFIQSFDRLSIRRDRINLSYRTGCGQDRSLVDDNFYIVPSSKIKLFRSTVESMPPEVWHHDLNKYVAEEHLHFMIEGNWYLHESPLFRILR